MKFILALIALFVSSTAFAEMYINSYSSTNVTTGAYVTLIASTPFDTAHIQVCDSSTHFVRLAIGAAGSEVDQFASPGPSSDCMMVTKFIPAGSRISLKAIDANATAGYIAVSLLR